MIRTLLIAAALVAFGLVIGRSSLPTVPVVRAQSADACTLGSFKGNYGYLHNGFYYYTTTQGYAQGVWAAVGRLVSDGNGTLTAVDTLSQDGDPIVVGRKLTGTYTIKDDCTGSATFTDASNAKLIYTWDLVLVAGGKEVNMIEKEKDSVISGVAKQQ